MMGVSEVLEFLFHWFFISCSRSPSRSTEINRPPPQKVVLAITASGKLLDFSTRSPLLPRLSIDNEMGAIQYTRALHFAHISGV